MEPFDVMTSAAWRLDRGAFFSVGRQGNIGARGFGELTILLERSYTLPGVRKNFYPSLFGWKTTDSAESRR